MSTAETGDSRLQLKPYIDEVVRLFLSCGCLIAKFPVGEIMNIKKRPNHKIYIQVLRQMSPGKRLLKAFELSEFANQLFVQGLHTRYPNLPDEEFKKILMEHLDKCHNKNY